MTKEQFEREVREILRDLERLVEGEIELKDIDDLETIERMRDNVERIEEAVKLLERIV